MYSVTGYILKNVKNCHICRLSGHVHDGPRSFLLAAGYCLHYPLFTMLRENACTMHMAAFVRHCSL